MLAQDLWCVVPAERLSRPIGTFLFFILLVWKYVSTKLKADLMGFEMVELSHGSVTSTIGSLAAMTVCSSEGLYSLNQLLKLIIQQLAICSLAQSAPPLCFCHSVFVCLRVCFWLSVCFFLYFCVSLSLLFDLSALSVSPFWSGKKTLNINMTTAKESPWKNFH